MIYQRFSLLFALLIASAAALISLEDVDNQFADFVVKHNKKYKDDEYWQKRTTFEANLHRAHGNQKINPLAEYGVDFTFDLTPEEFNARFKGYDGAVHNFTVATPQSLGKMFVGSDPTNWDWNPMGYTTPVKQQGQCNSCWAFSTVENVESYWAIAGGGLQYLSMEQVVDCNGVVGPCQLGNLGIGYSYVGGAGLASGPAYPYTQGQSGCQPFNVAAYISGYYGCGGGEGAIYNQIQYGGPVSTCVATDAWYGYQGGVLTSCPGNPDHCVQITGYYNWGLGSQYWNIRNSWGPGWGNGGYIAVAGGQGLCGLGSTQAIYPTIN